MPSPSTGFAFCISGGRENDLGIGAARKLGPSAFRGVSASPTIIAGMLSTPDLTRDKEIREIELESLPEEKQIEYIRRRTEEVVEFADSAKAPDPSSEPKTALLKALLRYEPSIRAFQAEAQRLAEIVERYSLICPRRKRLAGEGYQYVPEVYQTLRSRQM